MQVKDFLSSGENTAVHLSELCRLTGSSETSVKAAVRRERLEGTPILSGLSGYWLAESEGERRCFLRMMEAQGESRLAVADAVRKAELGA